MIGVRIMSTKEVIWLDTGQRFESTHEAAEKNRGVENRIEKCLEERYSL